MTNDLIRIGKLNKTFGLKGHIRGFIEPEYLDRLKKLEVVFLVTKTQSLPYFIDEWEISESGHGMFHFEEVKDKTAADLVVGREMWIDPKLLKKEKAFSTTGDFVGFTLIDEIHGTLGALTNFFELPGHDLGEFIFRGKEVLFPWNDEVVKKIDKKKKEIQLQLPEGLLDIYLH